MKPVIPIRPTETSDSRSADATVTLRAVAKLPAKAGLEDRLKAALAERVRAGGFQPGSEYGDERPRSWMHSAAMRGLAAAAIVLVVVGGGWGIAQFGRQAGTPQAVGFPHGSPGGDFSNAGAMRTPRTLTPPAAPKAKHDARKMDQTKGRKPHAAKHAKAGAGKQGSSKTPGSGAPAQ
ncbi:MAG TPA: hypothetical protein VGR64_08080 [Terracidiphilus sp.]|nr:hypothetical protein [Terracidiphilus sp.]